MRAFLAVPCGQHLTEALSTVLDDWRGGPGGRLPLRWTRPVTWHLTLQFLGEWPDDRLATLQSALAAGEYGAPFTLLPGELGGFPHLGSPRVLFLHLEGEGRAARLASRVRATVSETWPTGPQDNRGFRSHLTLARTRSRLSRPELNLLQDLKLNDLPPIPVEGFSLISSELRPTGPRYTELAAFALRK
jgi:2'-5' RNA ligase